MRYLITGGNRGLGRYLCQRLNGDSYSRGNGYDIAQHQDQLAQKSLEYDVVINNAYDHSFSQTILFSKIAALWKDHDRAGHIINIGGIGSEDLGPPWTDWENYNAHKRALKHMSLQWTQAFRTAQIKFRTSLLTVDRLDKKDIGDGHDLSDIADKIELCLNVQPNTCVGEIKAWVNLDYKQLD